jgi:hypothetical protein
MQKNTNIIHTTQSYSNSTVKYPSIFLANHYSNKITINKINHQNPKVLPKERRVNKQKQIKRKQKRKFSHNIVKYNKLQIHNKMMNRI